MPVGVLKKEAGRLRPDHDLATRLWASGWCEARMLAAFVDDPARVTPAQMERWCRDFDSWAIVDTVCFALFDRTPHAWEKVEAWAGRRDEFERGGRVPVGGLLAGLVINRGEFIAAVLLREQYRTAMERLGTPQAPPAVMVLLPFPLRRRARARSPATSIVRASAATLSRTPFR